MSRVQAPLLTPCGKQPRSLKKTGSAALAPEALNKGPGSNGGSNPAPVLTEPLVGHAPQALAPSPVTPSPRAALLATLLEGARVAVLAGDLATARIAHETIGKMLGAAEPLVEHAASGAPVVDLAEERRRRERQRTNTCARVLQHVEMHNSEYLASFFGSTS